MNAFATRTAARKAAKLSPEIQGEPGTGYEGPNDLGEFECENCAYFDAASSSCGQATMKAKSKQPRLANGRVQVDPEGCCGFVKRIGQVDELEEEEINALET